MNMNAVGGRLALALAALVSTWVATVWVTPAGAADAPKASRPTTTKPPVDEDDEVTPLAPRGLQLRASPDILTVGATTKVMVVDCDAPTATQRNCSTASTRLTNWSVNGVRGGNDFHGNLSTAGPANSVVYTAPNVINWNEIVAVSANLPSSTVRVVLNIRLVPKNIAYTGTIKSTLRTEGTLRRFTAEVGFDEDGQGSGRARFFARDDRCTGEDPEGQVRAASFTLVPGLGPSGGDTYYQLGLVVFTKLAMKCKSPSGEMAATPPIDQADSVSFVTCRGMRPVAGTTGSFTPEGLRAVKLEGDGNHLTGSVECALPESGGTHRLQWDLRRVAPP